MSKFNTVIENNLNKTDLLRIRIKHDPANNVGENNDYVGYVLEEDGVGNVIAIVPGMGPEPVSLSQQQITPDMAPTCGDPLSKFKKHVVTQLMAKGHHDEVSNSMESIINAKDVVELEKLIQSYGCDVSSLLNLYRDFVTNG